MHFVYNIAIAIYGFAIRITSLFNAKAKDWVVGRKHFWEKLPDVNQKNVIWFHCASLGEFDQGLPLMNLIKEKDSDVFLLVTFFSPSGYKHYHKRTHSIDFACYLPLDTPMNAQKFVHYFQPKETYFVKYEFWSNYIFSLKKSGSKLFSISTILRPKHRFFKWYGSFFRRTLEQFDFFFVQNTVSQKLLQSINIQRSIVSGDTRFDRVIQNKNSLQKNATIDLFVGNSKLVFICGSTWPIDEELLFELINSELFEKVIIAPHQIDQSHVKAITSQLKRPFRCISEDVNSQKNGVSNVLILDSIGQLSSAYSYAHIAYVGGGFTGKLHNILEPAVFGLPVIFGPKHSRFPEADSFIEAGFGFEVTNKEQMRSTVIEIIDQRESLSEKARAHVEKNAGATHKIYTFLSTTSRVTSNQ